MYKRFLSVTALMMGLAMATTFTACSDDNTPTDSSKDYHWSEDGGLKACDKILFNDGQQFGNGDNEFVFKGKQTIKRGTYTLKGWVYVADGAELTIEPGTVIKGDKQTMAALIVERGGKLIAQGSQSAPIVFTSEAAKGQRKPGDWGGLIICGKAPHNAGESQIEGGPRSKHGGNDPHDNSGILSYVRVEFAGYPFEKDKEINGITFGSVGDGTKVDHLQVSYSNDDSYEWFGGTVNCKNLIAFRGWDDDFDTDNGFSGQVQYGLSVRDARIADVSQSNGFESDNDASGSTAQPYTSATFSNMTFVGPKAVDEAFENSNSFINAGSVFPNNGSALGLFQSAMQIRRGSRLNCINAVAMGWPIGLILDGEKGDTQQQATNGTIKLQNVWFGNMTCTGSDANKLYKDNFVTGYDSNKKPIVDETRSSFSSTWFLQQAGNRADATTDSWLLQPLAGLPGVNIVPMTTSPLFGAASFAGITSSWFDKVNFIGAFGTDNWTAGWANFDPQNADY